MQGATEYYHLFNGKSQQIGRLFFQLHTHARGECFEIFLIPEGVEIENGKDNVGGIKDRVEVYGVTSGQRGWTETYGWLHKGKWTDDFNKIVEQKIIERDKTIERRKKTTKEKEILEKNETQKLLDSYA